MADISQAQANYLHSWAADPRPEVKEKFAELLAGRSIASLDRSGPNGASVVISQLVAQFTKPVKGNKEDHQYQEGGRGQGEHDHQGDGIGLQGDGEQGGQGQGQGDDGQGDGQGQGDGDGDGEGDGKDGEMRNDFREGSKEHRIAQALIENNMDEDATFESVKDEIGDDPLEFKQNDGMGGREPLPMGSDMDTTQTPSQKGRAKKLIKDTKRKMEKDAEERQGEQGDEQEEGQKKGGSGGSGGSGGGKQENEHEFFQKVKTVADIVTISSDADGRTMKDPSMRGSLNGAKLINHGIPAKGVIQSLLADYPVEVRRKIWDTVKEYPTWQDAAKEYKRIQQVKMKNGDKHFFDMTKLFKNERKPGQHPLQPILNRYTEAGVPTFIHGPAGGGKTHACENACRAFNEKYGTDYGFGFASMTAGTSPGEFKGRVQLDGFLPSLFAEIFANGGLFLFDEIDAAEPNLMTMLNSALANGEFVTNQGKLLKMHKHFMPVAAGNTLGLGATHQYAGRNRQDGATLDRFAAGRLHWPHDKDLELELFWQIAQSRND